MTSLAWLIADGWVVNIYRDHATAQHPRGNLRAYASGGVEVVLAKLEEDARRLLAMELADHKAACRKHGVTL